MVRQETRAVTEAAPAETGEVSSRGAGRRSRNPAVIGVAAATIGGLVLRLALLARSLVVLDRLFIPDDTYYTLTIARSIAHGHGPTTDGHTLTTGFQPLLAFVMTPVFWITDGSSALRINLLFLVLVDAATIAVLGWIAYRVAGSVAAIVASGVWAISPVALSMALGGLETSLAIFFDALLVAVWIRANDRDDRRWWIAAGAVAGLAVLARIDGLLLVVLLALVQLARGRWRDLVPAAIAGTVVLAPWWIWSLVNMGTVVPTSGSAAHALVTTHFDRTTFSPALGAVVGGPFDVWNWLRSRLQDNLGIGSVGFFAAVVGFLLLAVVVAFPRARERERPAGLIVATLPVFAAGLLLFYAWFGITWYFTRYLAPVAMVVTLLVALGAASLARVRVGTRPVGAAIACAALVFPVFVGLRLTTRFFTAHDRISSTMDAATGYSEAARRVVATIPSGSVAAGMQTGATSYWADERFTMVNLDGVVNPDAYRAARKHRIAAYARSRGVTYLVDWSPALSHWFLVDVPTSGLTVVSATQLASVQLGQNMPLVAVRFRWGAVR
jgi:Dolichyl-phosphate-mannose-protein mannosyltransferase